MASIIAQNISLVFPLVGSDSLFGRRLGKKDDLVGTPVGGKIITGPGKKSGVMALDNLNLNLKDGDRLGIFGHNGAGKSTLLRVLGGIYPPTSGHIHIDGKVAGMFSLGLGLNKEASGLENINIKGLMYGLRRREIKELVPEIVEFSELGDYIHMPMKTYSSGMVMRLLFSIASALKPDILLLDEWISSGDLSFKQKVDERLEMMLEETPIVIIASHNENRLYGWANRVITLQGGRVLDEDEVDWQPPPPPSFKADREQQAEYNKLINFGKLEEAIAAIETVWPEDKDPGNYHARRAHLFNKLANEEEAMRSYEQALIATPDNAKLHEQVGRIALKSGNYTIAAHHLEQAITLSHGQIGKAQDLKAAFEHIGKPERAIEILKTLDSDY